MGFLKNLGNFGKTLGKAMAPVAVETAVKSIPFGGVAAGIIIQSIGAARRKGGTSEQQMHNVTRMIRMSTVAIISGIEMETGREITDEAKFAEGMEKIILGVEDIYGALCQTKNP